MTNPQSRAKIRDGHEQYNYKVKATDGSGHEFVLYKRQNLRAGMEDDFSCGLSWIAPNGETLTLKRYNGPNHNHPNHLEKEKLGYNCHIHIATEKYIKANRKADGYAEITEKYRKLKGAFHCLVVDSKINGIDTEGDDINQVNLFD